MSELFRKEVYDTAYQRLDGEVLLATPLSVRILAVVCLVLVVTGVSVAAFGTYARRETVQGMIVPSGGLIRVTARQGGVVETLAVREGQQVAEGASLAALRVSADVDGQDASRALLRSVDAAYAASKALATVQENKLAQSEASLKAQRDVLQAQLAESDRRIKSMEAHKAFADQALARGQSLFAKGFLASSGLEQLQNASLAGADAISEAKTSQLSAARQLHDVQAQLQSVPLERANNAAQAAQTEAQFAEKRVSVAYQSLYGAVAPISGTVIAVAAEVGQSLAPGATVAVLAPKGSRLVAEVYVPSSAAGFVKPGQEVMLKYDAFRFESFGAGKGKVISISRTALNPNEIPIQGLELKEPMFRVLVAVGKLSVRAYDEERPLRPGMKLTADIVVEKRSLIQWVLDPLYAAGVRT